MKSDKRLKKLGYDPLKAQVALHKRLIIEDNFWTAVRHGDIKGIVDCQMALGVDVDNVDKIPRYSSVMHVAVLSGLNKVANDLLRYGYARVPEGDSIGSGLEKLPPLQITLT